MRKLIIIFILCNCHENIKSGKDEFKLDEMFKSNKILKFKTSVDSIELKFDTCFHSIEEMRSFIFDKNRVYFENTEYLYGLYRNGLLIDNLKISANLRFTKLNANKKGTLEFKFSNYKLIVWDFKGFSTLTSIFNFNKDTVCITGHKYIQRNGQIEIDISDSIKYPIKVKLNTGLVEFEYNNRIYKKY